MNGWITLKSVHKVDRIPEVMELLYLVLRSKNNISYTVSWEHSHVTAKLDDQGYLEVNFILTRSKEFFPTLSRGEGKFDHMQTTSTFLEESSFVDLLHVVCFAENRDLGSESLRVYSSTLKETSDRTSSFSDHAEIYGLTVLDMYPTTVEISDEGKVYTYLYRGSTTITPDLIESVDVLTL